MTAVLDLKTISISNCCQTVSTYDGAICLCSKKCTLKIIDINCVVWKNVNVVCIDIRNHINKFFRFILRLSHLISIRLVDGWNYYGLYASNSKFFKHKLCRTIKLGNGMVRCWGTNLIFIL